MHKQLWPEADVPKLLVPTADRKKESTDDKFFVESTIPTSFLFAALCSQASLKRGKGGMKESRYAASSMLHKILTHLSQTGDFKLSFTAHGNQYHIPVPTTGMFPVAVLTSMLEPDSLKQLKNYWNESAEDIVFWG